METNNTSAALPYPYPIVFLFLYSVTAVLSFAGNILVAIVLIVRKRLTKKVRYLLVNLAAADFFMTVIGIPFTCYTQVYGQWLLPSALCTIAMFVQDALQAVSVLTITAIGIDRYFAILFPLKFRWLKSHCAIIMGFVTICLVAIGDSVMNLLYSQKLILNINGVEISVCNYAFPTKRIEKVNIMSNILITYPIPFAILVFSYSSIAWKLYHRTSPGNADAERDLHQRQNTIKVIKMLVVIVAVFVLCWAPLIIMITITVAMPNLLTFNGTTQRILVAGFTWLGLCNCFANPVIYCFSNKNFWKDFKFIFEKTKEKLEFSVRPRNRDVAINILKK